MQQADMELEVNAAVNGQQFVLGLKYAMGFSLNQQTPQMREYSPMMLEFLNIVVKQVLREAQFK